MSMEKSFIISEFGTKEAQDKGVSHAEYFQIGIDAESWRMPTIDERTKIRESMGFDDDEFIVLTIAANQERKNLAGAMEMFKNFAKDKKAKWALVTLEHFVAGWKLRDLAIEFGINEKFLVFERGIPFKNLWSLYAASDAFLLPSKAEGLGLPLLEAMAVGLPCIATDCTGMKELLSDDRGILLPWEYTYRDPFGNGRRYMADIEAGTEALEMIYNDRTLMMQSVTKAREYVENRDWNIAVQTVHNYLKTI